MHEVCKQLAANASENLRASHTTETSSSAEELLQQRSSSSASKLRSRDPRLGLLNMDGRCEYCERRDAMTTDHFMPLVKNSRPTGYCNDTWNSVPCCKECNSSKGGKTYDEWFSSQRCRLNPTRSEDVSEATSARLREKFARYHHHFTQNCERQTEVDRTWWDETSDSIDRYLSWLQQRVDAYVFPNSSACGCENNAALKQPTASTALVTP